MLEKLKENDSKIKHILAQYDISLHDIKVFGEILGQQYPISASAHFIITPSRKITDQKWENLKIEMEDLFPDHYLKFYTPDMLDCLVAFQKLRPDLAEFAKNNAQPLSTLFLTKHSETPELKSQDKKISTDGFSFFKHELSETVRNEQTNPLEREQSNAYYSQTTQKND